jgi:hypothetical protein
MDSMVHKCKKKLKFTFSQTYIHLSIISFKALIPSFRTDLGGILYAKRKSTVEPVYGIIKHVIGFHLFMLRGLQAVPGRGHSSAWPSIRSACLP